MGAPVKRIGARQKVQVGGNQANRFRSPIDKAKGYEVVWKQVSGLFEAARPFANACYVYVIGEEGDGPVKIGVSKDPISRLRGMQTGNPRRLRIEHVLMGDMAIERLMHEFWEPFAIVSSRSAGKPDAAPGTEWFNPAVRETLLPIVATAAEYQTERLLGVEDVSVLDMERIVRQAHIVHGYEPRVRDETRILAQGAGYVVRRPSRI